MISFFFSCLGQIVNHLLVVKNAVYKNGGGGLGAGGDGGGVSSPGLGSGFWLRRSNLLLRGTDEA